jgi:hypothetical protein
VADISQHTAGPLAEGLAERRTHGGIDMVLLKLSLADAPKDLSGRQANKQKRAAAAVADAMGWRDQQTLLGLSRELIDEAKVNPADSWSQKVRVALRVDGWDMVAVDDDNTRSPWDTAPHRQDAIVSVETTEGAVNSQYEYDPSLGRTPLLSG